MVGHPRFFDDSSVAAGVPTRGVSLRHGSDPVAACLPNEERGTVFGQREEFRAQRSSMFMGDEGVSGALSMSSPTGHGTG